MCHTGSIINVADVPKWFLLDGETFTNVNLFDIQAQDQS